uniref:Protein kinase domain-containing protein n=1 Tax=Timema monikensis TaxID=170555 RepID=A0A7R9HIS8_9NEOP|nr:unnamed protein product [Timema monikensis]
MRPLKGLNPTKEINTNTLLVLRYLQGTVYGTIFQPVIGSSSRGKLGQSSCFLDGRSEVLSYENRTKNVLIKKDDETGEMTAVVGDFGLAAKIPDSLDDRLSTVGSPYWMSPECLKGHWYNEKSDVFSNGIVLCELIARIEADPDVLPRTENFGLDYIAFTEMCGPCPPEFLKLAFSCCTFEPKSRPSFSEIVLLLEKIIADYQKAVQQQQLQEAISASLPVLMADEHHKVKTMSARSEEVISSTEAGEIPDHKDLLLTKRLSHRRSLSEDVGSIVFPPHTAPSDKARCHFVRSTVTPGSALLINPKDVGEIMCLQDPHYKPTLTTRTNPFAALSQFHGVKKILGGPNKGGSPSSFVSGHTGDLFSSCFELPSPFYGPTPPSTPTQSSEAESPWKFRCPSPPVVVHVTRKRSDDAPLSLPASPTLVRRRLLASSSISGSPASSAEPGVEKVPKSNCCNSLEEDCCPSQPSKSSLFGKRTNKASSLFTHPLFKCSEGCNGKQEQEQGCALLQLPQAHQSPLTLNQRGCSSSLNLADPGILLAEDPGGGLGYTSNVLRRHGSCESGFFSSVGEDFGLVAGDLLSTNEFAGIHPTRSHHNTSSATLSSSSAASSLFLLDDSAVSTTTVSSLRSGSGELGDLDDLTTGMNSSGAITRNTPHHHSLLFAAKRSSSIYTDSSEDISSLGGGDLSYWEDRGFSGINTQPQQISKYVEYFEKMGANINASSRRADKDCGHSLWESAENQFCSKHQRDAMFHQASGYGNRTSPMEFARRMEGASLNDAIRSSKIALLRKKLERMTSQQMSVHSVSGGSSAPGLVGLGDCRIVKRTVNATQRLMICEGAVKSKLPLFDKK